VSKIKPIVTEKSTLVSRVSGTEAAQEWFRSLEESRRIDAFLGHFVEVAAYALDGGPLRGPFAYITPLVLESDNRLEMFEEEQELRQLFERLVVVAEWSTMAVRGE
jgi:hypothetical protein